MLAETARKPKHSKERDQLAQLYAGGLGGGFFCFVLFNSVIVQASGQASSILDSVGLYPLQL